MGDELLATIDGHWVRALLPNYFNLCILHFASLSASLFASHLLLLGIQLFSALISNRIGNYRFKSKRQTLQEKDYFNISYAGQECQGNWKH